MSRQWHQVRFTPSDCKEQVSCAECGAAMWLPKSKVGEYLRCGAACNDAFRERRRSERRRECITCGRAFLARWTQINTGGGKYCSQACNEAAREALHSADSMAKAASRMRALFAEGAVKRLKGPANPRWRGGPAATRRRQTKCGDTARWRRRYLAENPEKAREFSRRRSGRKLDKLPYGTVPKIGAAQRWRCAICDCSIRRAYHLDHIEPLARGGRHVASNLQLLCQPCNLRKSARDPIVHMRSLGFLL